MEEVVCWDLCWGLRCLRWGESCFGEDFGRGRVEGVSVSRAFKSWDERRRAAIVAN